MRSYLVNNSDINLQSLLYSPKNGNFEFTLKDGEINQSIGSQMNLIFEKTLKSFSYK